MDEDGVKNWHAKVGMEDLLLFYKKLFVNLGCCFYSSYQFQKKKEKSETTVIHCGLASVLQSSDDTLNKTFYDRLREKKRKKENMIDKLCISH